MDAIVAITGVYDAAHAAATISYEAAREVAATAYEKAIAVADDEYMEAMNRAYREREAARAAAIDAPLPSWCAHDDGLVWGVGVSPEEAVKYAKDEGIYEGDYEELETDPMTGRMAARIERGVDVRWTGRGE